MGEYNISNTTISDLTGTVKDFSVKAKTIDSPTINENTWDSPLFPIYHGYYRNIPELKKAIDALAIWTVGKGWITDARTKVILEHITGWGEDSFQSILENLIIMKKMNGDAFAEIIMSPDNKVIINLKPLAPNRVRIVVDAKGLIDRYEYLYPNGNGVQKKFKPEQIFHISNDRIGDEIHGVSVIEACKWVIDARQEAMADWRRILHRSTIRVMYIDADDTSKINDVKTQYADAIKKGELLIIPAKRSEAEIDDLISPPITNFLEWIRYLEGFFYQAVGIPRVIATSENFTEAASKVGYLTFEPIYTREQTLLEADLWNQLGIKIKFERPASLGNMMQESEAKNTGQTGFQPNELNASVVKNE